MSKVPKERSSMKKLTAVNMPGKNSSVAAAVIRTSVLSVSVKLARCKLGWIGLISNLVM